MSWSSSSSSSTSPSSSEFGRPEAEDSAALLTSGWSRNLLERGGGGDSSSRNVDIAGASMGCEGQSGSRYVRDHVIELPSFSATLRKNSSGKSEGVLLSPPTSNQQLNRTCLLACISNSSSLSDVNPHPQCELSTFPTFPHFTDDALPCDQQVARYTALFSGVVYGWYHRRTLQAVSDANKLDHIAHHRKELISEAKLAWRRQQEGNKDNGQSRVFMKIPILPPHHPWPLPFMCLAIVSDSPFPSYL